MPFGRAPCTIIPVSVKSRLDGRCQKRLQCWYIGGYHRGRQREKGEAEMALYLRSAEDSLKEPTVDGIARRAPGTKPNTEPPTMPLNESRKQKSRSSLRSALSVMYFDQPQPSHEGSHLLGAVGPGEGIFAAP